MRLINLVIVIIAVLLGMTFSIMNGQSVALHYYFGVKSMPLALLMWVSLIVGALLGLLALLKPILKLKHENRRLRHEVASSQAEVENLRHIPIRDEH